MGLRDLCLECYNQMMSHKVEVDQSGRLEQLNTDTVIAFANGSSRAVVYPVPVKQRVARFLNQSLIPKHDLQQILFAILVFLLIEPLPANTIIKIDEEYTGKENVIATTLEKLLRLRFGAQWTGDIRFGRIGRHSSAHHLAWKVHRARVRPGIKTITEKEILKYLS